MENILRKIDDAYKEGISNFRFKRAIEELEAEIKIKSNRKKCQFK